MFGSELFSRRCVLSRCSRDLSQAALWLEVTSLEKGSGEAGTWYPSSSTKHSSVLDLGQQKYFTLHVFLRITQGLLQCELESCEQERERVHCTRCGNSDTNRRKGPFSGKRKELSLLYPTEHMAERCAEVEYQGAVPRHARVEH